MPLKLVDLDQVGPPGGLAGKRLPVGIGPRQRIMTFSFGRLKRAPTFSRALIRTAVILALALSVLVIGVVGFALIEDWSLTESLYMTIITITTVGFGEVKPLHDGGRLFTIFLILCGVVIWAYAFGSFSRLLLEGQLGDFFDRRRTEKMIKSLKDHIIVCGFGRMGRLVSREIAREKVAFVVLETDPGIIDELTDLGYLHINGDATEEDVLEAARVRHAKSLIAVLANDAGNVYVVLTARALNPNLHIICRAENPGSEGKMKRAGATKVITPYEIGGRSLAQAALRPNILNFFEMATTRRHETLAIEELLVPGGSPFIGKSLAESGMRETFGVSLIAHQSPADEFVFNPSPRFVIQAGAVLLVMGRPEGLKALAEALIAADGE